MSKFAHRRIRMACRTRGKLITDNRPGFFKTQKLTLPLGRERRNKRGDMPLGATNASTTMIIASCSFHSTAHDYPKIIVCNDISSFLVPVAIRRAFLFTASLPPLVLRALGREATISRARVAAYFDIALSKVVHIYLIVVMETVGGSLTFFNGRSSSSLIISTRHIDCYSIHKLENQFTRHTVTCRIDYNRIFF